MVEINKGDLIFTRGEDGTLIAQDVVLESIPEKPTVKVKPLTRGKLQEVRQLALSENVEEKSKADTEIIKYGLVSPALTEDELTLMKPNMALAITQAILAISLGISQEEVGKKTEEAIENQEYLLAKK